MSTQPNFQAFDGSESTGRFLVTFREKAVDEGLSLLASSTGIGKLASTADFKTEGVDAKTIEAEKGVVFANLGIAVVSCDPAAAAQVFRSAEDESAILSIEPERIAYASRDEVASPGYLQGYSEGVSQMCQHLISRQSSGAEAEEAYLEEFRDDTVTWGLRATRVNVSRYCGSGIRVAVLDTGLDEQHPDFANRHITSRSFIAGQDVDDLNGHGTHCTGTACGPRNPGTPPRYGIAYNSSIFIGKVLSNSGSGSFGGILAGIDWAVANRCEVLSMSLGADIQTPSPAFEAAGERALAAGSLIVAAAGNNGNRSAGNFGFVGVPANSRSIMAVGALDSRLQIANFSARSSAISGGEVDIAGPGVDVYSSWPLPTRYRSISGTSMATPHVAGIAALYAQAYRARGYQLWQLLTSRARRLSIPSVDVGAGLVIAP
ncbi:S8 family serine peptidase [Blastopirellula marina]|uniref:Protease n=1 Tax=Blastopirellula marina TaxID=124 RepID=A0A2S8GH63_9BACT|nr:S8 family serine peptidase [Blastopirellula marina]PQO43809.1 protease [Blastopirellula marina]